MASQNERDDIHHTVLTANLYATVTLLVALVIVREYVVRLERAGVLSISAGLARILTAVQALIILGGLH